MNTTSSDHLYHGSDPPPSLHPTASQTRLTNGVSNHYSVTPRASAHSAPPEIQSFAQRNALHLSSSHTPIDTHTHPSDLEHRRTFSIASRPSSQVLLHDQRPSSAMSNHNGVLDVLPPEAPSGKLRAFYQRNKGLAMVLLAQVFGTLMNVTTRLLEIQGNNGKGMHPFQVS